MANYALEGAKWGSPAVGTAGGPVTWAFDSSVPASFQDAFTATFNEWSAYGNIQFRRLDTGSAANIVISYGSIDGAGNTAGITNYTYSGGSLVHATITIDSAEGWHLSGNKVVTSQNFPLALIASHEEGHAIGLGHYSDTQAVMNPVISASINGLQKSDIDGIQALYGKANTLVGSTSNSVLNGGSGDDTFVAFANGSTFNGGAGNDTVTYEQSAVGVIIDLAAQQSFNGTSGDLFNSIENATGSQFGDGLITGGTGVYRGLGGNDTFLASANGSLLDGGAGSDTVSYERSAVGVIIDLAAQQSYNGTSGDLFGSIENAIGSQYSDGLITGSTGVYRGLGGNDAFLASANGSLLDGGAGNDTVSYERSAVGVIIDLAAQQSYNGTSGDLFSSIENATGSQYSDGLITGGTGVYRGLGGNDTFAAGANGSLLDGGAGTDTVSYERSAVGVIIDLAAQQSYNGASGDLFSSIENAIGSQSNDGLIAGNNSVLTGGAGFDAFNLGQGSGAMRVTDFVSGTDTIQFSRNQFSDFSAMMNASAQVGSNTVITLNNSASSVTLANVSLGSLQAGSFQFT
ncbi:matrixin family metalloprotease [Methylobacterium dankookense]|uniref:Bifunctional hemolysin/adenylate cyclase n=1 Tax=Methylobacterium dankookense TaxID=560405 RepID=A0A564FW87_9HYPH|nr:matrixin family metalloprotease [Methylobacterium dankookense]GJD54962.1 hypothetical protein IFDJLNFL_0843 [Methylobacterium dankookense]VUF11960.1 Bifunctional hemolysin/adenylate cyclase [Methylobacterium dankookense]